MGLDTGVRSPDPRTGVLCPGLVSGSRMVAARAGPAGREDGVQSLPILTVSVPSTSKSASHWHPLHGPLGFGGWDEASVGRNVWLRSVGLLKSAR